MSIENLDLTKINPSTLLGARKVHFIGIGGIGVSAIARMFLQEGKEISGSDRTESPVTEELEKLGAKIKYEQVAENISSDIDLVVYTIAVSPENPELWRARELKINCLSYPEMLGLLSAQKFTIAISGTHGKTTTTAMIAKIMIDAGLDPTVIVGSFLKDVKSNFVAGKSDYLVVEACEYRRSFLNLSPKIVVITNIDNDHLDYYRDLRDIQSAFAAFLTRLPADGVLVCNPQDPVLGSVLRLAKCSVVDYRLEPITAGLSVPGEHNIRNAQAALAVVKVLKVVESVAMSSLQTFSGTWRRFETKGKTADGALVYDDYAHHPTEVSASLTGARELMTNKKLTGKLIVVFQPHLYSRTKLLKDDFIKALATADLIILAPIYAARENPDHEISSTMIAEELIAKDRVAVSFADFETIIDYLKQNSGAGDLIVTMGAGDIYKVGEKLLDLKLNQN